MRDRRYVEDLSIKELEQVLLIRRREERLARLRRMGAIKHTSRTVVVDDVDPRYLGETRSDLQQYAKDAFVAAAAPAQKARGKTWRERILMGIEGAALLALIAVIASLVVTVRNLNQDWRDQQAQTAASYARRRQP